MIVARPSSAKARGGSRRPGSITVHPSRRPAPAATKTAVSSKIPCGAISPKNSPVLPAATM